MYTIWTGERVRLRPFRDEQEYCAMEAELHREPNQFWGPGWHPTGGLKKEFEDSGALDPLKLCVFCIERLDTGEAVGIEECGPATGANSISAWLGTAIKQEHWHKGFGLEAKLLLLCFLFESYPYQRVWSDTLANHKRAAAGLAACGMQFEGRLVAAHFNNGQYHDMVCYGINREEWEQMPYRHKVKRG